MMTDAEFKKHWASLTQQQRDDTEAWTLTPADKRAVRNGCWFNRERGEHAVAWIEEKCVLYEGDKAGQKMELGDWQYDATMRLFGWVRYDKELKKTVRRFKRAGIWISKKNAKPIDINCKIPTPCGLRPMGDLQIGDEVLDEFKRPCKVVGATPPIIGEECYELEFSDGSKIIAGAGHEWPVQLAIAGRPTKILETVELYCGMLESQRFHRRASVYRIRMSDGKSNYIIGITPVSSIPVRCITVDSASHLYLVGESMIPTHNSPTLAAWGLYLFCGDGEMGQKCYSLARDGKQAMISHRHAIEMVKRSPQLRSECKINAVTGQIAHLPTSSIWSVVAGDNPKSQEGLNGSILVDELHVVSDVLMKVVEYAGISRHEPLHIEVSTAGNNPESYGKRAFDRGRRVERAEPGFEDDSMLYIAYCAPQDLTADELDKDPLKYGRMANPTMGRIVRESEFLESYHKAKQSLSDLLEFLMYRLNIWQRSSNPWLREADWIKCRYDFTEDDLLGRTCWAGLDLSRTTDFSALVLCFPGFPEDGHYAMLPYFWLPEAIANQRDHLAPFRRWAAEGFLTLTPGNVIDYGFIKSHFRELAKKFNILEIAYDPKFAEEVTQSLEQGVIDMSGKVIEEGTGVIRYAFAQDDKNFAVPTLDFERLVIEGKLRHNNHPVLSWQAGHANAHVGWNKVKRVFKPTKGDVRTVDGIIGSIMALGRAMKGDVESWYTPGCIST